MFQQFIPPGPSKATEPAALIDRTQILNPKDYWREPMACPDWPVVGVRQGFDGRRGKEGAEDRLHDIGLHLNRGAGMLRAPTSDEREQELARTFRRSGSPWHALGIVNLSALGMMAEADAQLIVEACHLRGYLRKLEARAIRDGEAAEHSRKSEARRTLEEYRTTAPAEIEELKSLAEAVTRHNQRLEDERAVSRSRMLRDHVETLHSAAVRAAHTLGLSVPDAPEILR